MLEVGLKSKVKVHVEKEELEGVSGICKKCSGRVRVVNKVLYCRRCGLQEGNR